MMPTVYSVSLSGNGVAVASSFTLTLSSVPQVGGTIVAAPPPTNGAYTPGTQVGLTAVPTAGLAFAGWSGGSLYSSGYVSMTANKSETTNFAGFPSIQLGSSTPQYGSPNGVFTGTVIGVTPSTYQIAALVFLSGQGWFSKLLHIDHNCPELRRLILGFINDGTW